VNGDPTLFDQSATPVLPYAGTSGHAGGGPSRERAERDDRSGATTVRQQAVLDDLRRRGADGATWNELGERLGLHHGQVSSALSNLHRDGQLVRLTERRRRSSVYVLPEHVNDREPSPWRPNVSARLLRDVLSEIDGDLRLGRVNDARRRIAQTLAQIEA
jgi:hypothetical protein